MTAQHINNHKGKIRLSGQCPMPIVSQRYLSMQLAMPHQPHCFLRPKHNIWAVMCQNAVKIMGIPRSFPVFRKGVDIQKLCPDHLFVTFGNVTSDCANFKGVIRNFTHGRDLSCGASQPALFKTF